MTTTREREHLEEILQYLLQTHGFDFSAYKRPSLVRRILKRMQAVQVDTFEGYFDYLQVHQDEFSQLFNTILINVTSFFRDEEVWTALAQDLLPALIERQQNIRVWTAGCASGQEPYSLAMLFAEMLGAQGMRERVKIYATDVDEHALSLARAATYPERDIANVKPEWLAKYFEPVGSGHYAFSHELRRAVIFGRHDLLTDVPISRVDLLMCRNTLMYFTADAQAKVLGRLYFSLNPSGILVLGHAEMLFNHGTMFAPVDLKRRVFRTVATADGRERTVALAHGGRDALSAVARLREAAFESGTIAQIILDANGIIAFVNETARTRFGLNNGDLGRPFRDLEVSYRPAELRGLLDRAVADRAEVSITDVEWRHAGQTRIYNIVVSPLYSEDGSLLGARITFQDITEYRSLEAELQHSKQELETAYEELQSTNEELQTTNEELQSTIEELETTNEELQSTNEELETMNEELQSANEELQTINDELRTRSTDLNSAHAFLESVFTSLRSGVVVVDRDLRVQVWNHRAEDLWGVRAHEAQRTNFLSLDIGLPVSDLRQPIRDILGGATQHADVVLPATSRRGRPLECRVTLAPLRDAGDAIEGVILLMDERREDQTIT